MQPGSRESVLTLEETVQAAARVCDPDAGHEGVTALLLAFEDDERPATAVEDAGEVLASAAEEIDPDLREPAVHVAAAVAHWLVTNPGDADDPERAIREGALLGFGGEPPEPVAAWLTQRGAA